MREVLSYATYLQRLHVCHHCLHPFRQEVVEGLHMRLHKLLINRGNALPFS